MGMSAKVSGGGGEEAMSMVAEINVTPLVDVMLVLLIIFMVTMPVMMNQLPITLPKPSLVSNPDDKPEKLTVSFDLQGNYFIQHNDEPKQAVAYADLAPHLEGIAKEHPDELVTVCADSQSIYDRVVDLMGVVGGAGFNKVTLCP